MTEDKRNQKPSAKTNNRGAQIPTTSVHVTVRDCSLGSVLIAATHEGVCAIHLGDEAEALRREHRDHFPNAVLTDGDAALNEIADRVVGLVESPRDGFDVPLDAQGTEFQRSVWNALRDIPTGTTASYRDVAIRIGAPRSVRAVARACAANTLAVAIPCHRVIRADGGLSGYRWGVDRKRQLLEREAA